MQVPLSFSTHITDSSQTVQLLRHFRMRWRWASSWHIDSFTKPQQLKVWPQVSANWQNTFVLIVDILVCGLKNMLSYTVCSFVCLFVRHLLLQSTHIWKEFAGDKGDRTVHARGTGSRILRTSQCPFPQIKSAAQLESEASLRISSKVLRRWIIASHKRHMK